MFLKEYVLNMLFRAVGKIIDFLQNRLKMKVKNGELTVSYRCHWFEWLKEQTTKETDVDKAEGAKSGKVSQCLISISHCSVLVIL